MGMGCLIVPGQGTGEARPKLPDGAQRTRPADFLEFCEVLLRWKNAPHTLPLVVVSTHLAKEFWCLWLVCPFHSAGPLQQSPDSHPCQTGRTGRCVNMLSAAFWQVTQIMASLTAFTTTHDARSLGCGLCLRMLAPWNFLFFRGQRLSCGAVGGPQCTPLWRDPRVWALG